MSSFDWRAIVKSLAPMLGTALGGPLGGVAGAALSQALGCKDADTSTLAAAVQGASPEQLEAIQKAEQDFRLQMAKLGFEHESDLERIALEDRKDARGREIAVRDWTPRIIAYGVVVAWASIQGFMTWAALYGRIIPDSMVGPVMRLLGTLDGALMLVLAYYFGSSAGSARKDELMGGGK